MKAVELRERTAEELKELQGQLRRELFGARMKNFTGQLGDTSQLKKLRRDLARLAQIQGERTVAAGSQS